MEKTRMEQLLQLLTDTENQPHQYVNDSEGLKEAFKEMIVEETSVKN